MGQRGVTPDASGRNPGPRRACQSLLTLIRRALYWPFNLNGNLFISSVCQSISIFNENYGPKLSPETPNKRADHYFLRPSCFSVQYVLVCNIERLSYSNGLVNTLYRCVEPSGSESRKNASRHRSRPSLHIRSLKFMRWNEGKLSLFGLAIRCQAG